MNSSKKTLKQIQEISEMYEESGHSFRDSLNMLLENKGLRHLPWMENVRQMKRDLDEPEKGEIDNG